MQQKNTEVLQRREREVDDKAGIRRVASNYLAVGSLLDKVKSWACSINDFSKGISVNESSIPAEISCSEEPVIQGPRKEGYALRRLGESVHCKARAVTITDIDWSGFTKEIVTTAAYIWAWFACASKAGRRKYRSN